MLPSEELLKKYSLDVIDKIVEYDYTYLNVSMIILETTLYIIFW